MSHRARHARPSAAAKAYARGAAVVGAGAIVAAGAAAIAPGAASAATTPVVSASTYIANHPDSGGHGNNWAYDDFTRGLTVTPADSSICSADSQLTGFDATADTCYTATVSDSGKFNAIVGADVPNGDVSGQITHSIQGTMTGTAGYTLFAPAADKPTGAVEKYQNDNFTDPTGDHTSPDWPAQAFATPGDVQVVYNDTAAGGAQSDWSYKYSDICEWWVDAGTSGDGTGAVSVVGNITGNTCVLSHSGPGYVVNANSGKALDVTGGDFAQGGLLQQWTKGADGGADQQFELANESNGNTYLVTVHLGTTYYVTSSAQGKQLTLKTYPSSGAVVKRVGSFYEFTNTGLVMDVTGRSKSNGATVQGYTQQSSNNANQQWSLP